MTRTWALSIVFLFAAGSACTPATTLRESSRAAVVTEVPDPGDMERQEPTPQVRYPEGSRLVRLDLAVRPVTRRVITEGLAAAGAPSASHDGERIVFVGKERPDDPYYGVWTCHSDGSERKRAVQHGADCGAAAFLPDGRVVYSAALDTPSPLPSLPASALFVALGDGTPGTRITFGGGVDLDPYVLRDGRIAYTTYLPAEGMERGRFAVFTVHPDGTGAAPLLGERGDRLPRVRVTQEPHGDLLLSGTAGVLVAKWAHPAGATRRPTLFVAEPGHAARAADGTLLVVGRDEGGRPGLWIDDRESPVRPADGHMFSDVAPLVPGLRPQGHLSMVKPEKTDGLLLAIDARPDGQTTARTARLSRVPDSKPLCRSQAAPLGEVPLAADGSFFARVPADTPLLLDLLDENGAEVVRGVTPFWVRPNEVRACIGCHEPTDTAPPNRRPLAVLADPVDLTGNGRTKEMR